MTPLRRRARSHDQGKLLRDLIRQDLQVSRSLLARLKNLPGGIRVNGQEKTVRYRVQAGDLIELAIDQVSPGTDIPPEGGPLDLVYEDRHVLVISKQSGQTMYPRYKGEKGSLASQVLAYLAQSQGAPTFHPIGRLDKDTAGLVLLAKSPYAAGLLQDQVHGKYYLAICQGQLDRPVRIDAPIAKKSHGQPGQGPMEICEDGQAALTAVVPLVGDPATNHTLVLARLHSGRRHQIRLHMSQLGHPLVGDRAYGGPGEGGQALWCIGLALTLPGAGRPLTLIHLPASDPRLTSYDPEPIISSLRACMEKGGF